MFLYTNPLFCNMFFSSLSERLSFSDLSYIVIKVIVASSIRAKASFFKVITLAPPLFPRPLLDMASRTFVAPYLSQYPICVHRFYPTGKIPLIEHFNIRFLLIYSWFCYSFNIFVVKI